MAYQESPPPRRGVLACVWTRDVTQAAEFRIVPDGCVDLIWNGHHLWVAGPDTQAHVSVTTPGRLVGARLVPGAAARALGVAADELRDGRVALADLWPSAHVRRLTEQLAATSETVVAQDILATALTADSEPDPVVRAVLGGGPVAAIAGQLGLSARQVHRRSAVAFGYGPKTVQKVLRFQRALGLARKGRLLADVAAAAGYSDQAHLARDVRALAGVPMGQLLRP